MEARGTIVERDLMAPACDGVMLATDIYRPEGSGPFPVGNLFRRGHRLRLDLSSSNFPHFDVNPNSGEPEGSWLHPRPARNRVFAAAERPSHILLPVIPSAAATQRRQSDRSTTS